ncbi:hypothetical protein ACHAWO_004439 [Cyclotella atomus]|uniref:Uncharacterized protein n=1 Tax=Cyclotella atomus TaxID=382360 RepID=A0ABD3P6Y2_9STRA
MKHVTLYFSPEGRRSFLRDQNIFLLIRHNLEATSFNMLNKKVTLALAVIGTAVQIAESGPASYATCQAGCAAAAGIAMCMSAGVCSIGCASAYAACQSACAAAAFAPLP